MLVMFGATRFGLVEPTILARLIRQIKSKIKRRSSRLLIIKKKEILRILLTWVDHVFLKVIYIAKLNLTEKLPPEHPFSYASVYVTYALEIYILWRN